MSDEKVYTPTVIADQPLPDEGGAIAVTGDPSTQQIYTPKVIADNPPPTRKIAHELIGAALNTKSRKILQPFSFTKSGAIQVGEYENAVSGDIRISPDGFVARNKSGIITVAIDGDTGDAVFSGLIQAGSIITGLVAVGDNSLILDGESRRIVVNDGSNDRIIIGNLVF
jgi:hypothetical protein